MNIILLNKTCKYHKCLIAQKILLSAMIQNPMEKIPLAFVKGTQGDANFRVGLQKYVIHAPLYSLKEFQRYHKNGTDVRSQWPWPLTTKI